MGFAREPLGELSTFELQQPVRNTIQSFNKKISADNFDSHLINLLN
jgi:hypothetical protein